VVYRGGMPVVIALVLLLVLASGAHARDPRALCATESSSDRLEAVADNGDLTLAGAGLARLGDIRLPDSGSEREQALGRLRAHIGTELAVRSNGRRDRWSRVETRLQTLLSPEVDLAADLVSAGLALVDPAAAPVLCRTDLLAIENEARQQGLGVWRLERYKPASVAEVSRLLGLVGEFVLVEGRIRSVGERQGRTYLNFGSDWSHDVTVVLPKKVWLRLLDSGLSADALRGRVVRVRGLVENAGGPALTVTAPETIEVLQDDRRLPSR
jgi:endonuclease YncB( thermonuclease family)